jgi:hypothetical protein
MVEIVWSSATDFGTSKKVGENMVPFKLSIRARLMLFIAALMAAIFVLAAIAVACLMTVDRTTMTMDRKWLMGTQILGALSERVAGFRIAETYMGQASDSGSLGAADLLATEQRNAITNLQREYTALGNSTSVAASDSLRAALREYFAAHDAWLKSDIDSSRDVRARRDSALHQLYGVVEAGLCDWSACRPDDRHRPGCLLRRDTVRRLAPDSGAQEHHPADRRHYGRAIEARRGKSRT